MIDKVCPVCGKKFVVSNRGEYLYKSDSKKDKVKYYCGYTCYHKDNPDKPFSISQVLHAKSDKEKK